MSKLDPRQTLITVPEKVPWQVPAGAPRESVEEAVLAGIERRRVATDVVVMLLFVVGGGLLTFGASAGLYLLLAASLVAFVSGMLNAWSLLLPPAGHPRRWSGR